MNPKGRNRLKTLQKMDGRSELGQAYQAGARAVIETIPPSLIRTKKMRKRIQSLVGSEQLAEMIALGKHLKPDEQENFVRGGLLKNAAEGKDAAVRSLELLGKDKRVNMFAAESQSGVINIVLPGGEDTYTPLAGLDAPTTIEDSSPTTIEDGTQGKGE